VAPAPAPAPAGFGFGDLSLVFGDSVVPYAVTNPVGELHAAPLPTQSLAAPAPHVLTSEGTTVPAVAEAHSESEAGEDDTNYANGEEPSFVPIDSIRLQCFKSEC
jgi:hypothetical protein